jgi:hypothetical protein
MSDSAHTRCHPGPQNAWLKTSIDQVIVEIGGNCVNIDSAGGAVRCVKKSGPAAESWTKPTVYAALSICMKSLIFRRARFRSGFRFASMQIPERNAEISSHKELTSIFGFSNATFARSS